MSMSEKHLNVCVPSSLLAVIDKAATGRGLNRSEWVRWALSQLLSEDEPYTYTPPTLPDWQVEAWTLLLRGLYGREHLVLTDAMRTMLEEAVTKLDERDGQVLRLRFGLNGLRYTLAEVGNMRGVQREAVRQVEARALRRLRGLLRRSGIWEMLEPQLELEKNI